MPLPNPTLTFTQTALFAVGGAANSDVIDAIEAAVGALAGDQQWTVSGPTGDAGLLAATLLTPPAGSPINGSFNAIIGGADGVDPAASEMLDGNPAGAHIVTAFGGAYTAGNNWYDVDAFGAGVRWSEYANTSPGLGGITHVYAVASEETIFIGFRQNATTWYGVYLGAIIEPPDLGSAEADERIYGMMSSGDSNKIQNLITGVGNFDFGRNSAGDTEAKYAIFNPAAPATLIRPFQDRRDVTGGIAVGSGTTIGGRPFFRAIYVRNSASPFAPLGRQRGMYFYEDAIMRTEILDSGAVRRGFVVSGSESAAVEAQVFGNASV